MIQTKRLQKARAAMPTIDPIAIAASVVIGIIFPYLWSDPMVVELDKKLIREQSR
jgi:hypothetical protein